MQDIVQELDQCLSSGRPVAWTALVETRGSTPQKAGAIMLVFGDGSQIGTLGGGCVEAEVKRRALRLLDQGETEILTFQLDNDYGWDDGLICGGRMKMLVDPIIPGTDTTYFRTMIQQLAGGSGFTEAVVINADDEHDASAAGDAPPASDGSLIDGTVVSETQPTARAADRHLFGSAGEILASRASGELTDAIRANLRPVKTRPRAYVRGGVSYLPQLQRCRLVIVGAGHVGQKVADLAADVDFDVWVVDDREQYCNPDRFPRAKRLIVGEIDSSLSGLDIDGSTFCIVVTRGHNHDEEALYHLAETPARYIGMIGSRRKIKLIFDDLLSEGISRAALSRVHAPLGLEIGSQTVPEIAISIVAELIACRNLETVPERRRPLSLIDAVD